MKKYIAMFVVLTLVILMPVAYPRWARSRREKRIVRMITEARQVKGTALPDILPSLNKNKVIILYTGSTHSCLEPYGYYKGRSGGVARRFSAIKKLEEAGLSPLILDAGEIFSGQTLTDQKKSETYLKTMSMMGYDAACVSAAEFTFGTEYLQEQMEQSKFPFLSANLIHSEGKQAFAEPYIIKDVGQFKVAVIGVSNVLTGADASIIGQEPTAALKSYIEKLNAEADVLVLLSNLSVPETRKLAHELGHIDVIISSKDEESNISGNPILCCSDPYGRTMGMLSLSLDDQGSIISSAAHRIVMPEEKPDPSEIAETLSYFHQQANDSQNTEYAGTRLFESEALEHDPNNGYIGVSGCASCHKEEHQQWLITPHASSRNSLERMQGERRPDCLICHVTGLGYETGYKVDQPDADLESVGCETCHGPGEEHAFAPTKVNIRGDVSTKLCAKCHTGKYSPGFAEVAHLTLSKVNHSQKSVSIKGILEERTSALLKPTMDLFVMSHCPFGVSAENKLIPILRELEGKVDFNLYFIAQENEEESAGKSITSQFKSLHGAAELIEDIRQAVIATHYKDKLFDYILEINKDLKKSWVESARKLDIDPRKVQEIMESEEGLALFRDNIKKSQEMGVRGSPTVIINSVKLPNKVIHAAGAKGSLCR